MNAPRAAAALERHAVRKASRATGPVEVTSFVYDEFWSSGARVQAQNAPMLALAMALCLSQVAQVTAPPLVPAPSDAPMVDPSLTPPDELPEQPLAKVQLPPDRPVRRVLLSSAAGVGGAAVALGITLALTTCFFSCNPKFDVGFANAALGGLLVAGTTFAVHQALGGGGEVILPALASLAVLTAASFIGPVIDPTAPNAQIISTAIGSLPAAVAVALILEATSSMAQHRGRW